MNWYEYASNAGWLKGKKPIHGNNVIAPMVGVPYRVPLSDESHYLGYDQIHSSDQLFICGRSVRVNRTWYVDMGASLRWGDPDRLVADMDTKTCAACRTGWAAQQARKQWEESLRRPNPNEPIKPEEYKERYGDEWKREEKQLAMVAAWVAAEFNGEIQDVDEV